MQRRDALPERLPPFEKGDLARGRRGRRIASRSSGWRYDAFDRPVLWSCVAILDWFVWVGNDSTLAFGFAAAFSVLATCNIVRGILR